MDIITKKKLEDITEFISRHSLMSKEILSLSEAALYMDVSKSYLYKLTSSKAITFSKPGEKLIFFKKADLDEWMLSGKEPSLKELASIPAPRRKAGTLRGYI